MRSFVALSGRFARLRVAAAPAQATGTTVVRAMHESLLVGLEDPEVRLRER